MQGIDASPRDEASGAWWKTRGVFSLFIVRYLRRSGMGVWSFEVMSKGNVCAGFVGIPLRVSSVAQPRASPLEYTRQDRMR